MKRMFTGLLALLCLLALAGCSNPAAPAPSGTGAPQDLSTGNAGGGSEAAPSPPHQHSPAPESNILPHEEAGYCGNTVTTICGYPAADDTASFWGDDSVALTDLLRYLDYSEGICRCLPEFTVETEFGGPYGINLTEGYARNGNSQVDLTEAQIAEIQDILDRLPQED